MQVTCLKDNLSKGLSNISRAVATRATLPVTQNVLLESDNGQLKLTATNTEISISTWIGAQIEGEAKVTIPARMLNDFINSLPEENVQMDFLSEPVGLKIKCGQFNANINGISAEEFPPIPTVDDSKSVSIPSDVLKSALERVVFAAATDDSRPVLTGVNFELDKSGFTIAAADGFRLAVEKVNFETEIIEPVKVIIPAKTLVELQRLLVDSSSNVKLSLNTNGRSARFKLDNSEVVTSLVQGTFPDYDKLIPDEFSTKAQVGLTDMIQATRAASIFARDGSGIIRLLISSQNNGDIKIISRAEEVGSNENNIQADVEGDESKVAFNSRFLLDVLGVFDSKDIILETNTPSSPGVFKSLDNPGYTHVIMPMFVQW
tara:strand:+ start:3510 stop:4634 length:1125 start_codon:yes stop_codon:yes gene_type:complete